MNPNFELPSPDDRLKTTQELFDKFNFACQNMFGLIDLVYLVDEIRYVQFKRKNPR